MNGYRYLADDLTLTLDQARCVGCGLCQVVCPHGVFELHEGKAVMCNRNVCMECGACTLNCPVRAIGVVADVGCVSGMINRWISRFNIRIDSSGSC